MGALSSKLICFSASFVLFLVRGVEGLAKVRWSASLLDKGFLSLSVSDRPTDTNTFCDTGEIVLFSLYSCSLALFYFHPSFSSKMSALQEVVC